MVNNTELIELLARFAFAGLQIKFTSCDLSPTVHPSNHPKTFTKKIIPPQTFRTSHPTHLSPHLYIYITFLPCLPFNHRPPRTAFVELGYCRRSWELYQTPIGHNLGTKTPPAKKPTNEEKSNRLSDFTQQKKMLNRFQHVFFWRGSGDFFLLVSNYQGLGWLKALNLELAKFRLWNTPSAGSISEKTNQPLSLI